MGWLGTTAAGSDRRRFSASTVEQTTILVPNVISKETYCFAFTHQERTIPMSDPFHRPLPYGIFDLHPEISVEYGPPLRVRCCIRGCDQLLIPPSRLHPGEVCKKHGVRVHRSATYSYIRPERNIIVARDVALRIARHPFKYECRFHLEKSEDALTFNTFRSFMEARCLNYLGRYITGLSDESEPRLFLWGIEQDEGLTPFNLLVEARERFERRLPVERPKTEPDAILYLPGRYIALIEAKLTSPNPYYTDGPRKDGQALTKAELLTIYADASLGYLDQGKAREMERVYYQLWRNVLFSEWMARADRLGTKAYFANLTRRGHENDSFHDFTQVIRPEFIGRITHISWEDLWVIAGMAGGKLALLQEYLLGKTANLRPAFDFRLW
jgi:hypothetical protein